MDKSDKILAAIEQLAISLTGQIRAVDAKLSGQIDAVRGDVAVLQTDMTSLQADVRVLQTDMTSLQADVRVLQTDVTSLQADVRVLQTDVTVLKVGQAQILEHLDVAELKGRVEEQSRTIASLIPTRVAAVPGR